MKNELTPDNLVRKTIWQGAYRSLVFEVASFNIADLDRMPQKLRDEMQSPYMKRLMDDSWTYYIYIPIDAIPAKYDPESFWLEPVPMWTEDMEALEKKTTDPMLNALSVSARALFKGKKMYRYTEHPIIGEIAFHSGATYYSREYDDDDRIIKVGCDFQHAWDLEREPYTLGEVLSEVKRGIDSIYTLMPEFGRKEKDAELSPSAK